MKDWNITIEVVPWFGSYGRTRWDRYKNAQIKLCSPDTLDPDMIASRDLEVTLVHELLHLHASRISVVIDTNTPEDDALEEMVEILAQTFVTLRRRAIANYEGLVKRGVGTLKKAKAKRRAA